MRSTRVDNSIALIGRRAFCGGSLAIDRYDGLCAVECHKVCPREGDARTALGSAHHRRPHRVDPRPARHSDVNGGCGRRAALCGARVCHGHSTFSDIILTRHRPRRKGHFCARRDAGSTAAAAAGNGPARREADVCEDVFAAQCDRGCCRCCV